MPQLFSFSLKMSHAKIAVPKIIPTFTDGKTMIPGNCARASIKKYALKILGIPKIAPRRAVSRSNDMLLKITKASVRKNEKPKIINKKNGFSVRLVRD